jgi:hypothetical protein
MENRIMRIGFLKYAPLALLPVLGIYAWTTHRNREAVKLVNPVTYQVIDDAMGVKMTIAVDARINEQELVATLSRAADDHQYDAARDLLLSSYFSVEAYLVDSDKRSTEVAGTIKRYVPPKSDSKRRDWLDWLPDLYGKEDKFSIRLDKARASMQ